MSIFVGGIVLTDYLSGMSKEIELPEEFGDVSVEREEFRIVKTHDPKDPFNEELVYVGEPQLQFYVMRMDGDEKFEGTLKFLDRSDWAHIGFRENKVVLLYLGSMENSWNGKGAAAAMLEDFEDEEYRRVLYMAGKWFSQFGFEKGGKAGEEPFYKYYKFDYDASLYNDEHHEEIKNLITTYMLEPSVEEDFLIEIEGPENGMVYFIVKVEHETKTYIAIKKEDNPFKDIIRWLEGIAVNTSIRTFCSKHVDLKDAGGSKVQLRFDPLPWIDEDGEIDEEKDDHRWGVFSVFDELTGTMRATAFCDVAVMVGLIYAAIKTWAIECVHAPEDRYLEFMRDWVPPVEQYEHKAHDIESWKLAVMDTYLSVLLEHYLTNGGDLSRPPVFDDEDWDEFE